MESETITSKSKKNKNQITYTKNKLHNLKSNNSYNHLQKPKIEIF